MYKDNKEWIIRQELYEKYTPGHLYNYWELIYNSGGIGTLSCFYLRPLLGVISPDYTGSIYVPFIYKDYPIYLLSYGLRN